MTALARVLLTAGITLLSVAPISAQRETIQTGSISLLFPLQSKTAMAGSFTILNGKTSRFSKMEDGRNRAVLNRPCTALRCGAG